MINDHLIATSSGRVAVCDKPGTDEDAPVLVFLHGSGFNSTVFARQCESPALAGFRRVAIDFPGHGRSEHPSDAAACYSFGGLAATVSAVLDELDIRRCILVGWSLGGHVALEMLDDEPRVAGALISGAPPMPTGPLASLRALYFSRDMLLASKARFSRLDAERFERLCLGVYANGEHVDALCAVDPRARPMLARSVFMGQNRDQRALALNARKPLFILQGQDDPIIRASYMQALMASPAFQGEGSMLVGAGHAPFIQAQSRYDEALAGFALSAASVETEVAERRAA